MTEEEEIQDLVKNIVVKDKEGKKHAHQLWQSKSTDLPSYIRYGLSEVSRQ